jgi:hypothetical protein
VLLPGLVLDCDFPTCASQEAGVINKNHYAWPNIHLNKGIPVIEDFKIL